MKRGTSDPTAPATRGTRWATVATISFLLLGGGVLAACGGGGGGGGPPADPNALLNGSYVYLRLMRDVSVPSVSTEIGTLTADGAGGITYGVSYFQEEGASLSGTRPPGDYDVAADRALTWDDVVAPMFHGIVHGSGQYAAATVRDAGQDPGLLFLMARSAAVVLADLVGSWHLVEFRRGGVDVGSAVAAVGEVDVDATGGVSVPTYFYNADGAINPVPVAFLASRLVVEAGGWVAQRSIPGDVAFKRGGVSADRNVIVLASVMGNASVWILVRQGLAAGVGSLSGAYTGHGFENSNTEYQALWYPGTFSGTGTGSVSVWGNRDGTIDGPMAVTLTYGVSVDVLTSIITTPANQFAGGTGPGGEFFLLGGGFAPGSSPSLSIVIR